MKYEVGQILTSKEDVEVAKALSGEKIVIPKGNKIIIGADNLAHHIRNGMMQPLHDWATYSGYCYFHQITEVGTWVFNEKENVYEKVGD